MASCPQGRLCGANFTDDFHHLLSPVSPQKERDSELARLTSSHLLKTPSLLAAQGIKRGKNVRGDNGGWAEHRSLYELRGGERERERSSITIFQTEREAFRGAVVYYWST